MRRLLTAIGLLVIVGAIFYGARGGDGGPGTTNSTSPRPGLHGLDAGFRGSKRPPMPAVELSVTDHLGNRINERVLRGNPTVFSFVQRHCKGECPAVLDQVRGALDNLGSDADAVNVVVIPTEQPTVPDIARLAAWRGLEGRMRVVSGPPRGIRRALREFKLSLGKAEKLLAYVVVVDRQLHQRVAYVAHTLTPEALASDLREILPPN